MPASAAARTRDEVVDSLSRPKVSTKEAKLKAQVDELGLLKAQISIMTGHEDDLKKSLIRSGRAEIDGDAFRATVSSSVRETLDPEMVKKYLTPAQIKKCTKKTPCVTVRVSARKRS